MMASRTVRIAQLVCASLWCLFAAGIVFGFAAFKTILIDEGIYSGLCHRDEASETTVTPCIEQDLKLNLLFTIAAAVTNVIALPVGWILDYYGPRICGIVGALWLMAASFTFKWSKQLESYIDPYMTGYTLLAIGGPFVFISCFQLANSFPQRSGTILALISGSFDSSSALFLFYRLVYQRWNHKPHLSEFFSIYLIVPIFIIFCQLAIMPHHSYKNRGAVAKLTTEGLDENGHLLEGDDGSAITSDVGERQSLLAQDAMEQEQDRLSHHTGRRKSVLETYVEAKLEHKTGGAFGILHGYSLNAQLRSPLFYLMVIFATVCMLRINYFVATIRSQEEYLLGDSRLAAQMNAIFDVALPLGGVLSIPFTGLILDHLDTLSTLILVLVTSVAIGVLGLVPHSFATNLIGILLLVLFRPFYYTVISDYVSKIFGFDNFGTVYGALISISGMCNMFQSVLDDWTHNTFKMNPLPVNSMLVIATTISGFALIRSLESHIHERHDSKVPIHPEASESDFPTYGSFEH